MDKEKVLRLLRKTADPDAKVREPAEQKLNAIHKIIGFCPTLLECVLHPELDVHLKQAAVIYLKNNVLKYWDTRHLCTDGGQADPSQYIIHEHDKKIITDSIVDAIVNTRNELISVHLSSIVNSIIKSDFPHKWPDVVNKVHYYLAQTNDPHAWYGALATFHQLAKIYEYRNAAERTPFLEALTILLPSCSQRLTQLLQNDPLSEQSCKLQKQILKSFHATLQYSLPLAIITREMFTEWMTLITEVAKRDVPDVVQQGVDNEDRPELIWWKCKKWAFHLLSRIFERYGSPNNVIKEYKEFAPWYIETFSSTVIQVILKILEQYALGVYVSPRVLQQALNYLNTAVLHSMTWKMLKDHMMTVVEKIIFPLMSHSDEDQDLWYSDPCEYIRMKFDIFEEYVSPVSASQNLLHSLCKKRKDMLQKTMAFVIDILNKPVVNNPRARDGALHMVGSIADVLIKKPLYQGQLEQLVATYLFPQFSFPEGFLRARACWTLNYFSSIEFKDNNTIREATIKVLFCANYDDDLPVKVEAALCLQSLLHSQTVSRDVVRPHLNILTHELVNLIRSTENEDVMEVLQKVVYLFPEELVGMAVLLTTHLAQTFHSLVDTGDTEEDEKISAAMAILSTIDTVLTMMDERKEVIAQLEPIVVAVILKIFERNTQELYEEGITLLSTITADAVSDETWRVFEALYAVFKRDGADYFTDMMSPIHNYITVDPQRFIASEQNMIALYDMCHTLLNDQNIAEELESYAAKLMEIIILQFGKRLTGNVLYSFVELAVVRLRREVSSHEFRTLLLQVVMAALWIDYNALQACFARYENQNGELPNSVFNSFMEQWLKDVKFVSGIHDRKMNILGFCVVLSVDRANRPPVIESNRAKILSSILDLCDRLKVAYHKKATAGSESTESSDEDEELSDNEAEVLEDDQDHKNNDDNDDDFEDIAEEGEVLSINSEGEDLYSDDDCEPTALESFETLIDIDKGFVDEFIVLYQTLESIFTSDLEWYNAIWDSLDEAQKKQLCDFKNLNVQILSRPARDAAAAQS